MQLRIAVANHKGGSGKTTATMLIASSLASPTYRVAVVDLDPQCSAQLWAQASGTFPAHVVTAKAENLAEVLATLQEIDAVLFDCPPSSTVAATLAAIDVAHLVVIPCPPTSLDYWATDAMQIAADLRRPSVPRLTVITQDSHTNLASEIAGYIEQSWPTANARLATRAIYRQAAAQGLGVQQLPGRVNREAVNELNALAVEVLTTAMKAMQ